MASVVLLAMLRLVRAERENGNPTIPAADGNKMSENKSGLEKVFLWQVMEIGLSIPLHEYQFHTRRRWRFDYAWIKQKVAVELEGGIWTGGRHNRAGGFIKDCEKYNIAAELGWRVFRYTKESLDDWSAIEQIKRVLNQ